MQIIFQIIIVLFILACIGNGIKKDNYKKFLKNPSKNDLNNPKQKSCRDIVLEEFYDTFQESIGNKPMKDSPDMYSLDNRIRLSYKRAKKRCKDENILWWYTWINNLDDD